MWKIGVFITVVSWCLFGGCGHNSDDFFLRGSWVMIGRGCTGEGVCKAKDCTFQVRFYQDGMFFIRDVCNPNMSPGQRGKYRFSEKKALLVYPNGKIESIDFIKKTEEGVIIEYGGEKFKMKRVANIKT